MSPNQQLLLLIPLAYLLGSVPFGLIVGLAKGIDPRTQGSGNIGATNLGRILGGRFFALVFTLDFLKGLLPTLAASLIARPNLAGATWVLYALWIAAGLAAILGHMFSAFLRLKGGKGVATSAGVILGIWPYFTLPAIGAVLAFGVCFALTRIVSLSSMAGAVLFPLVYLGVGIGLGWDPLGRQRWPLLSFAVLIAFMVVWKHRTNIARLRAGTEPKMVRKRAGV